MNNFDKQTLYKKICDEIEKLNKELDQPVNLSNGLETRLLGGDSPLDSLLLVTLIVNIEEAIESEFGVTLTIADERAMSRRVSPFASVGLLTDYVFEILTSTELE